MSRRFPAPWTAEQIPGGYKVVDATGQALAYIYGRETREKADVAKDADDGRGPACCGEHRQVAEVAKAIGSRRVRA